MSEKVNIPGLGKEYGLVFVGFEATKEYKKLFGCRTKVERPFRNRQCIFASRDGEELFILYSIPENQEHSPIKNITNSGFNLIWSEGNTALFYPQLVEPYNPRRFFKMDKNQRLYYNINDISVLNTKEKSFLVFHLSSTNEQRIVGLRLGCRCVSLDKKINEEIKLDKTGFYASSNYSRYAGFSDVNLEIADGIFVWEKIYRPQTVLDMNIELRDNLFRDKVEDVSELIRVPISVINYWIRANSKIILLESIGFNLGERKIEEQTEVKKPKRKIESPGRLPRLYWFYPHFI